MITYWRTFLSVILFGATTMEVCEAGYDGIYKGESEILLASRGGKPYHAPSTLVMMPDLKSAIATTTFPNGALSQAVRGSMSGNTFIGRSEGKWQAGAYNFAMNYRIKFVGDKAFVDAVPVHDAYWAKDANRRHKIKVFRKVSQ
jgi:hypothetical protein